MNKKLKKVLIWTGLGALAAGVLYLATRPAEISDYEMSPEELDDYNKAMALAKQYDEEEANG